MSEIGSGLMGSIDEAALAIENLYNGGTTGAEAPAASDHSDTDPDTDRVAAQLDQQGAEPDEETQEQAAEAEPEGNEPVVQPSTDGIVAQAAKEQTPQPIPAPQAPPKAEDNTQSARTKLTDIDNLITFKRAQIALQFPDVRSIQDLQNLAAQGAYDRVIAYNIAEREWQGLMQERQQAEEAYNQEWRSTWESGAASLLPEWSDADQRTSFLTKLTAYAKEQNVPQDRINGATPQETAIIRKAMLYDERVKADEAKAKAEAEAILAAKKKAADAPQVQKPGTPKATDKKVEKVQELNERFRKTGRLDDLAALLDQRA